MAEEETEVSELVVTAAKPKVSPPGVGVFQPQVSILLKKNIGRATAGDDIAASERFKGSKREIDLTPYLGEGGAVSVSRSVREPAGMFSITLVDRMEPEASDSLYGLFEPMDVVHIRMARSVADYAGKVELNMPLIMRGFITSIRRDQVITEEGPRRAVVITGQDYGKILQIMRIVYHMGMPIGVNLISAFKLTASYNVEAKLFDDAAEFVEEIVEKIVLPFLKDMRSEATEEGVGDSSPVEDILVEATYGANGSVSPFGANQWDGGTIYDLLAYFGDVGPWNELFIEDREDAPYLVYRPTPFRNLKGELIQDAAVEPLTVDVNDVELMAYSIERTDAAVGNYYWVEAPRYTLPSGVLLRLTALDGGMPPSPYLKDYRNSAPEFYGTRMVETTSQQGIRTDGLPEAEHDESNDEGVKLLADKRRVLIENNRDNVVFEQGTMQLRGNERIKAGCYVRLTRTGGLVANHYAYQVNHDFVWGGAFTTSIVFERGTGFVERIQREGGKESPYLAELNPRGTYG